MHWMSVTVKGNMPEQVTDVNTLSTLHDTVLTLRALTTDEEIKLFKDTLVSLRDTATSIRETADSVQKTVETFRDIVSIVKGLQKPA